MTGTFRPLDTEIVIRVKTSMITWAKEISYILFWRVFVLQCSLLNILYDLLLLQNVGYTLKNLWAWLTFCPYYHTTLGSYWSTPWKLQWTASVLWSCWECCGFFVFWSSQDTPVGWEVCYLQLDALLLSLDSSYLVSLSEWCYSRVCFSMLNNQVTSSQTVQTRLIAYQLPCGTRWSLWQQLGRYTQCTVGSLFSFSGWRTFSKSSVFVTD